MKKHYSKPFTYSNVPICMRLAINDQVIDKYRDVTCLQCISVMIPGEQMWHDRNNQEWIAHKKNDKRKPIN